MTAINMSALNTNASFGYAPSRSLAGQSLAGRATTSQRSRLRMTARGRAVLLTLVATPLVIAALAFGINAGAATGTNSSTPLSKVTVVGGETLWGLASQIAPNADPRDVIDDIMSVNRLTSTDIQPGEQLLIPAQYAH